MQKFKNLEDKGITLISLVITIIILVILATISIATLTGDNGILIKTSTAKIRTEYASAKEIIKLKLVEIQAECIINKRDFTLLEIENSMQKAGDITIEKYYNKEMATIKNGVDRDIINLSGIVVSADEYAEYKFLIGKTSKIEAVLNTPVEENTEETEFIPIKDFEKEILGIDKSEPIKVEPTILTDPEEFTKTIQEQEKLEYIIKEPGIFMEKILEDEQLSTILFENEKAMDLIISSDDWRNKVLESNGDITGKNSPIIKALDSSGAVNLPTTGLELYDPETKTGNVLYSSYTYNSSVHSPINAFIGGTPGRTDWENAYEGFPAYIGYDFGEGNEVWIYKVYVQPGNNTAPTKMFLQSSNDNIEWETIYEFTQYTTPCNETTEIINSENNNKRSRYWRLYITESTDPTFVDLLKIQFYGK